jgi:hypothetical protein
VALDTRKVPREVAPAVLFVLAEHVSQQLERQAVERLYDATPVSSPAARCW